MRSPSYNRRFNKHPRCKRPDECSSEFSKRLYFDNHQNFQCSFDINNYFFQTIEYDRFKIKYQDIGIFDFQFFNLKSQRAVIDSSRLVFIDVYNFIECIYTLLKDNLTAYKIEQ